jgi:hypothetical protein
LFWVAFIAQALESFLDASANVTFRLPKATPRRDAIVAVSEVSGVRFRCSSTPDSMENDDGTKKEKNYSPI